MPPQIDHQVLKNHLILLEKYVLVVLNLVAQGRPENPDTQLEAAKTIYWQAESILEALKRSQHTELLPGHTELLPGHTELSPRHTNLVPGHTTLLPQAHKSGPRAHKNAPGNTTRSSQNHLLAGRIDSRNSQTLPGAPRSSQKLGKSIFCKF